MSGITKFIIKNNFFLVDWYDCILIATGIFAIKLEDVDLKQPAEEFALDEKEKTKSVKEEC